MSTTLALRTTKFLHKEVEYMPWQTASRNLDYFFLMFDRSEVYGPMQVCEYQSILFIVFDELILVVNHDQNVNIDFKLMLHFKNKLINEKGI